MNTIPPTSLAIGNETLDLQSALSSSSQTLPLAESCLEDRRWTLRQINTQSIHLGHACFAAKNEHTREGVHDDGVGRRHKSQCRSGRRNDERNKFLYVRILCRVYTSRESNPCCRPRKNTKRISKAEGTSCCNAPRISMHNRSFRDLHEACQSDLTVCRTSTPLKPSINLSLIPLSVPLTKPMMPENMTYGTLTYGSAASPLPIRRML